MENIDTKNARYFDVRNAALALLDVTSIEVIDGQLKELGISPADGNDAAAKAEAFVRAQGVTDQGHWAAVVINMTIGEGKDLDGKSLTRLVAQAFPNANVNDRHGPHYLSHARYGRLKGLRKDLPVIPHARRASKSADAADADIEIAKDAPVITVELLLEENKRDTLISMAQGFGIETKKNWSTQKVAEAIVAKLNGDEAAA